MHIDFPVLIMRWLNFGILIGLILKFGWKPLMQLLDGMASECAARIDQSLEDKNKSLTKLNDVKQKFDQADEEIEEILSNANEESDQFTKEIEEDTEKEIIHLRKHNEAEIKNAVFNIRSRIQKEFAHESIKLSKEIVQEKATTDDLLKFNDDFLTIMGDK